MSKPASAPNSLTIFVPYRPPSRNQTDGGTLRQRMRHKRDARAAWSLASFAYATALSMMTTGQVPPNTCETPSPQVSDLTTEISELHGNTDNSKPEDTKAS